METPVNVRGYASFGELFSDANLSGRMFVSSVVVEGSVGSEYTVKTFIKPSSLAAVYEAVEKMGGSCRVTVFCGR